MKVDVRPLDEADLDTVRRVHRAAFGSFLGLPDPQAFRLGADAIGLRWRTWPEGGFVGTVDGRIAASGLMMNWGSVCILGPLTVAPEHWSRGIARQMMDALVGVIDRGGFAFAGLFTFPQSATHIRLYESYGFRMQRITAIMSKAVVAHLPPEGLRVVSGPGDDVDGAVADAAAVTGTVFPGLDVGREIREVARGGFGDTVILTEDGAPAGVAICHHGPMSEASEGQTLVKFAAVTNRSGGGGRDADERFARLLAACEGLASSRGAERIIAGTNTGRTAAYEAMQAAGFRTDMNGVAMMRPATDGYNTPDVFAVDDWR
jgi:ribosomal protein S18 acetylase RimI-like enzyme